MLTSDRKTLCSHIIEAARMKIMVINWDASISPQIMTVLKRNEVVQVEELIPEVASKLIHLMHRSIYETFWNKRKGVYRIHRKDIDRL